MGLARAYAVRTLAARQQPTRVAAQTARAAAGLRNSQLLQLRHAAQRAGARRRPDPAAASASAEQRWCEGAAEEEAAARESAVLNALVGAGARLESLMDWMSSSRVGRLIAPQHVQANSWAHTEQGQAEPQGQRPAASVTDAVLSDVRHRERARRHGASRVAGVPINRTEHQLVAVSAPEGDEESAFTMLCKLLFSKQYLTTQQQATEALYALQPDFHEPTFVADVERNLLPCFLDAFWRRDVHALRRMCSSACVELDILPHLKQYEGLSPRCRLLFAHNATLFNRMMFVDDSDVAMRERAAAAAAEEGAESVDLDCDAGTPEPEAVLLCSVHACIVNCWVGPQPAGGAPGGRPETLRKQRPWVRIGDPERPENWVFILGLTPEPGGRWSMSVLSFCRAEAMGEE
eukprot:TRINITY_DN20644_c0_g1_i1.p1 TRINITY_DN20644_c0_g1~~TRINITY_DN20644_c0_g1_i1.p1  ORF type:complete len:405 (+),score=130.56 TRINITY_DN20644_c0_g1_i1:129-1343(+)